jgi:hypothetical protein
MKYTAALDQNDWTIMNLFMVLHKIRFLLCYTFRNFKIIQNQVMYF